MSIPGAEQRQLRANSASSRHHAVVFCNTNSCDSRHGVLSSTTLIIRVDLCARTRESEIATIVFRGNGALARVRLKARNLVSGFLA